MQRHAWVAPVCLSTKTSPMLVPLHPEQIVWHGHILSVEETIDSSSLSVQCLPLYSLLLALNRTKIDYFNLDVKDSELEMLRTIPFDLVDIRVR
ncbi:hypothetical protein B566_EDAN004994 [Ephemera danica]|nr:hypothetical protein B566_EDAN004994 [Ephemera danica]